MSIANRILKSIHKKPLSIKQLYKVINDQTQNTIRARVYELLNRKLVRRFNGKIMLTENGMNYINNIYDGKDIAKQYNFITDKGTKIWAESHEQAQLLAKVIYGSKYIVKNIE